MNSGRPTCSSSTLICWLRAGWLMNRRAAALPTCNSSATTAKYRNKRSSMAMEPTLPPRLGHVVEDHETEALADRQDLLRTARGRACGDAGFHEEVLHLLRWAQHREVASGPLGEIAIRMRHAARDVSHRARTAGDLGQPVDAIVAELGQPALE